jgi:spore maturation protein CgeB
VKKPHILYIGQLWHGGTCLERMKLLSALGCEVIPFDTTPWITGCTRIEQALAHRTNYGRPVTALNYSLQKFCRALSGITHLWIDKGRWIFPEILSEIKGQSGATAIHYTPDPQLLLHRSRHFIKCIPLYDLVVTTKTYEVELYKQAGAKKVMLVLQGYDDRFTPVSVSSETKARLESDICFIGHCERHYADRLRVAREVTESLKVWGPNWPRYTYLHRWARGSVTGNGIWGGEYPLALMSSKIALGLLSKRIPETTTTRTFEIPASGTFLLAERTDDHAALFKEGSEAEFFDSDEELRDKLSFYLREDDVRNSIARAGLSRCIKSGYHVKAQLQKVLEAIA